MELELYIPHKLFHSYLNKNNTIDDADSAVLTVTQRTTGFSSGYTTFSHLYQ